MGANLINDYYDSFGSDPLNRHVTPFSGGSRVIQDRQMSPGRSGPWHMCSLPWAWAAA